MTQDKHPSGLTFAVARITIEFTSTFAVGTGRGDNLNDAICVADANGLPALPGSSIAGVLRAAVAASEPAFARSLFGFQPRGKGEGSDGAPSRLEVSWGVVHDGRNRPVAPLRATTEKDDDILDYLREGVVRDHVRISRFGVVDGNGKFDVRAVPAGARFTFELRLRAHSKQQAETELQNLVNLLASGAIRIGARTRRGAGSFQIVEALLAAFDLANAQDRNLWKQVKPQLHERPAALRKYEPKTGISGAARLLELPLNPCDLWIFGTGQALNGRPGHFTKNKDKQKAHDKLQVWERRIVWSPTGGTVEEEAKAPALIAATGIKGALRHRTLFHALRLSRLATTIPKEEGTERDEVLAATAQRAALAVKGLLGTVDEGGITAVGHLSVNDIFVTDVKEVPMQHVAIDRFTQAPMDGFLYSEAPVRSAQVTLKLQLSGAAAARADSALSLAALRFALLDLAESRLSLGSGANRGHGYFRGDNAASARIAAFLPEHA